MLFLELFLRQNNLRKSYSVLRFLRHCFVWGTVQYIAGMLYVNKIAALKEIVGNFAMQIHVCRQFVIGLMIILGATIWHQITRSRHTHTTHTYTYTHIHTRTHTHTLNTKTRIYSTAVCSDQMKSIYIARDICIDWLKISVFVRRINKSTDVVTKLNIYK